MEYFNSKLSPVIDRVLGLRCKQFGYQYSEIIRSLMCVYLCGGSCVEDLSSHLLRHLSLHPTLRTCFPRWDTQVILGCYFRQLGTTSRHSSDCSSSMPR